MAKKPMTAAVKEKLRAAAKAKAEASKGRTALKTYSVFGLCAVLDEFLERSEAAGSGYEVASRLCGRLPRPVGQAYQSFDGDATWYEAELQPLRLAVPSVVALRCASRSVKYVYDPETDRRTNGTRRNADTVGWVRLAGVPRAVLARLIPCLPVKWVSVRVFKGPGKPSPVELHPLFPAADVCVLLQMLFPAVPTAAGEGAAEKVGAISFDRTLYFANLRRHVVGYTEGAVRTADLDRHITPEQLAARIAEAWPELA